MTNGSYKTTIGWTIILSHIAIISLIFVLDALQKLEPTERSAALAATIPSAGTYLSAAVIFFLKHEEGKKLKWSALPVSGHTVAVSFLLPGTLFLAAVAALGASSLGQIDSTKFGDYMMYIQTAQAVVCGLIYGRLFRKELEAAKTEDGSKQR